MRMRVGPSGPARFAFWLRIDNSDLRVQMSYGFRAKVPLTSIESVREFEGRSPLSIGVHGWCGRWLVNGSREGLVVIELAQPARGRVLGFPVKLRKLTVSVDSPAALIAAL